MPSIGEVIQAQVSCRLCPLYDNVPVPLYVPLHVHGQAPVIIFDRPFSDVVTPASDPRYRALLQVDSRLSSAAVTYLTSCWSAWSSPAPPHSVTSCNRHRQGELNALNPQLVIVVGEASAQAVTVSFSDHAVYDHPSGFKVLCLPGDIDRVDPSLVRQCVDAVSIAYELL